LILLAKMRQFAILINDKAVIIIVMFVLMINDKAYNYIIFIKKTLFLKIYLKVL